MTWTLYGYGTQEWSDIATLLESCECAWADYDGFQIGRCPTQAPPYSHLWSWNADGSTLWRVRIDGARGIVGRLSSQTIPNAPGSARAVDVRVSTGIGWGLDSQVSARAGCLSNRPITVHEVQLPLPATFISMETEAEA